MTEHSDMRASDADREQVADDLRRATDEGRLLAHEFDERLGAVLSARTYGELDAIVSDLPRGHDLAQRPDRAGTLLRRRPAVIAMTAGALATVAVAGVTWLAPLTATSVRTSSPAVRAPQAAIPAAAASSRAAHHVLSYATTTTAVAASPPTGATAVGSTAPRGSYSTTATTPASPLSR